MPRADRMFALVQLLSSPRRRSMEEITSALGTSQRTIFRDLADLEARGVAIERVDGRYRILDGAALHQLALTDRERLLLTLLLQTPAVSRQPSFRRTMAQLRVKLGTAAARSTPAVTTAGPERSGEVREIVTDAIEQAIAARHSISILYTSLSSGTQRWRAVDPWALTHRSEAWYLVGRCHERDEARTFRLDRISAVLPIGTSFEPPSFDVTRWFSTAWGVVRTSDNPQEVCVLFESDVAPLIEHAEHHPGEQKLRIRGGRLEYRVRLSATDEIARWIAGFGGSARAVEPPELVERVRALSAGALAAHAPAQRAAAMKRRAR